MGHVRSGHEGLSMRRTCRWLRLRRSTAYEAKGVRERTTATDASVVEAMWKVRRANPAWGFRLMYAYLRNQGQKVGRHRAHRLYTGARMNLHRNPRKPRTRRVFQELLPPGGINEGWAVDFLSEWVIGEKQQGVRIINVVDERSRKDLWVEASHSITAAKLVETLDNGPEFISHALGQWAQARNVEIKFIQAGKPTQNGIVERLNGTIRKECLNLNWFCSLEEINDLLGQWFKTYNFDRPHSSLNYMAPATFENVNQSLYFKMVP